jgi:hypothetical protein
LLVGILIYSKSSSPKEAQEMFQNILLAEYHGTMTHLNKKIHPFCQPSK